jgi:uncharacterized protein YjeT (DUF2065 family)
MEARLSLSALVVLNSAAGLIVLGGLYDLFAPRLPANLAALCGETESARRLARELLRALGGALVAVGAGVAVLVDGPGSRDGHPVLLLVLLLVLPSEGVNAVCMFRVGSAYFVPLGFVLLTVLGVVLAW